MAREPGADRPALELHILACMLADRERGAGLHGLAHYLARFAEHPALVRACHRLLSQAPPRPTPLRE